MPKRKQPIRKSDKTVYEAYRSETGTHAVDTSSEGFVLVDGEELDPARAAKLVQHSFGYNWGYWGSGPSQTALAILLDFYNDERKAMLYYRDYAQVVVSQLPIQGWRLTGKQIRQVVEQIEEQHKKDSEAQPL